MLVIPYKLTGRQMKLPMLPPIVDQSAQSSTRPLCLSPSTSANWTVAAAIENTTPRARLASIASAVWNSAWTLLVLCNLLWASNIVVGRVLLMHMPAVALSFWRWVGAFAVAFWFSWPYLKQDWRALLSHWKLMLILAATGIAAFNTTAYIGLAGSTALNVLLLQSCLPLLVIVWAFVLFREQASIWQLLGVAISLIGVAVVASHGSMPALLALQLRHADLWIFASVVIYGVYAVLLRKRPAVHPLSFMLVAMGLGALMIAPLYGWELSTGARIGDDWRNYAGILYMAVFPSFISYLFFNRAVQLIGAARAGQSTHLIPIFGCFMAVLLLGESIHPYYITAVVLIAAGIVLAQLKARPRIGAVRPVPSTPE